MNNLSNSFSQGQDINFLLEAVQENLRDNRSDELEDTVNLAQADEPDDANRGLSRATNTIGQNSTFITTQTTTPIGNEFRVNSTINGSQVETEVTALSDGGFVVTWRSLEAVYGQRYDMDGNVVGSEFQITGVYGLEPAITGLTNGGFVATWVLDGNGIYGRRYDANSNPITPEFLITTNVDSDYSRVSAPAMTALTDGGFIVTWRTPPIYQGTIFSDVYGINVDVYNTQILGQRYDANGSVVGSEFSIGSYNYTTFEGSGYPSVSFGEHGITTLSDGGFVVTWLSYEGSHFGSTVYDINIENSGRRYDANGSAVGSFSINSSSFTLPNNSPARWLLDDSTVTALSDGGFVVVSDIIGGIRGQRYDANSLPVGSLFTLSSGGYNPEVTALPDGGFVVIAEQYDSGSYDIYGQRFDASGSPVDSRFRINSYVSSQQSDAAVASLPNGRFVATWQSFNQNGSDTDIYGQIVSVSVNALPIITLAVSPSSVLEDGADNLVYTFTRTGDTTNPLTVDYSIDGTATNGTDYGNIGNSVTFTAGSSTATVTVDPTTDTVVEPDETVVLTLASGTGYTIGTPNAATGSINELASFDDVYEENDTLGTAYDLTAFEDTQLSNLAGGEAIQRLGDNDWYKIEVSPGEEYLFVGTSYQFGLYADFVLRDAQGNPVGYPNSGGSEDIYTHTLYTFVDPGIYYIEVTPADYQGTGVTAQSYDLQWSDLPISAFPDSYEENDTLATAYDITQLEEQYLFSSLVDEDWYRIEVNPGEENLEVSLEIDNILNPIDLNIYNSSGNLVTGRSLQKLPYGTAIDTDLPSAGTYYIQLIPNGIGNVYSFFRWSDQEPDVSTVTLAVSNTTNENGTTNLIYTFTRTGSTANALTVNYSIGGTATNGTDYESISNTITFAANSATATLIVNPTPDTLVEPHETVIITLTSGSGYTIGTTNGVTATITNDDGDALDNELIGGSGNDNLNGGLGNDTMIGASGNDKYFVDNIGDVVIENSNEGRDTVNSSIDYTLGNNLENLTLLGTANINGTGNSSNNILTGNTGNNILTGRGGNDQLNGSDGNDLLIGNHGNDNLTGGLGLDQFKFNNLTVGVDTITDFSITDDIIVVSARGFGGGLRAGIPAPFIIGTRATSASDRFIYNPGTGTLSFDVDGNGVTTAVQFATLNTGLALTSADILVV